jgi:hypothetical protein
MGRKFYQISKHRTKVINEKRNAEINEDEGQELTIEDVKQATSNL